MCVVCGMVYLSKCMCVMMCIYGICVLASVWYMYICVCVCHECAVNVYMYFWWHVVYVHV